MIGERSADPDQVGVRARRISCARAFRGAKSALAALEHPEPSLPGLALILLLLSGR
jgi:hypothetical protein